MIYSIKESNIDLNEVVITGTKSEKTLKNVPVITQVITARKMLDLGITNVPDALQTMVPGSEYEPVWNQVVGYTAGNEFEICSVSY